MQASEKVRRWREEKNLTQDEMARLIGCSQSVYSRIERGLVTPSPGLQRRFFAETSVSPNDWVLTSEDEEEDEAVVPQGVVG